MGAGRKTQTFTVHESNTSYVPSFNGSVSARRLQKNNLGGVIFGCTNNTIDECLKKQLFGLPASHFSYVKNIESGLPLFLFNYSNRKLHGRFESASCGQMNIDPYGWTENGSERTAYPAQVRVHTQRRCHPLIEKQFRPILSDNFYTEAHFWFELDHSQVERLLLLLKPIDTGVKRGELMISLPNFKKLPPVNAKVNKMAPLSNEDSKSSVWVQASKYEALAYDDNGSIECGSSSKTSPRSHEDDFNAKEIEVESVDLEPAVSNFELSSGDPCLDGKGQLFESNVDKEVSCKDEDMVLLKLKQVVVDHEHNVQPAVSNFELSSASPCLDGRGQLFEGHADKEVTGKDEDMVLLKLKQLVVDHECNVQDNVQSGVRTTITVLENEAMSPISSDLHFEISQLRLGMQELKALALEHCRRNEDLEKRLNESEQEIQQLKSRVMELESSGDRAISCIGDSLEISPDYFDSHIEGFIHLIGGYESVSWLSRLDCYSPSRDEITPLRPMSAARSYGCATALNDDLYVLGGGDGSMWYDTVERYSPSTNTWAQCPRLIQRKGSLAGATVKGKIFALGGGNGHECFSDVEMFDPMLGRWINTPSMLQKRFSLAATELNGVIYALGGYDGKDYLNSAERFDPREASWTRIPSMNKRRGCHSVAVLNEKLYALGGFDAEQIDPSVEIFDPRSGAWMKGDQMNCSRGYAAVAILGDSIYVIGGTTIKGDILDTVEYYKEGQGWRTTNLRAVGRRSFFSAVVL